MLLKLTMQESIIMQEIWKAGTDISQQELRQMMKQRTGEWLHRNTISSFLKILSEKHYISTYHKGKYRYIHIEKSLESEIKEQAKWTSDFFFQGDKSKLIEIIESE